MALYKQNIELVFDLFKYLKIWFLNILKKSKIRIRINLLLKEKWG